MGMSGTVLSDRGQRKKFTLSGNVTFSNYDDQKSVLFNINKDFQAKGTAAAIYEKVAF